MLPEQVQDVTPKAVIEGIIAPRLEEIYNLLGEEIEKSGFIKMIPSGIVMTGGGAQTFGMIEMGRKLLGLPIRIGVPSKLTGLTDEINDPQFAATSGLIYYGNKFTQDPGAGSKDFNKVLQNFSLNSSVGKVKDFFKQFMP